MKILCLFVRHGSTAYPDALEHLDGWYEHHGLLGSRRLWIIDNALPEGTPPRTVQPGRVLRAGDNRAWEFSAWQSSLSAADFRTEAPDIVHFVTSAFKTLYTGYLGHFARGMLDFVRQKRVALGHIDAYDTPVRLGRADSQAWLRTCFFFLAAPDATRVPGWAAYRDPAEFFAAPDRREFRPDAPLCEGYRARLASWLQGHEMGGHAWHSAVREGPAETERFQRKALAILNEHNLAINLRLAGIPLVDFCWLHSQWPEQLAPVSAVPAESEQLRVRRRILGIPN